MKKETSFRTSGCSLLQAPFVAIFLITMLASTPLRAAEKEGHSAWGVNTVLLKTPWDRTPSVNELLEDKQHTISLNKFHRDGGQNIPATPTECRIAFTADELLVVFRCEEPNLSFPAATRDPEDFYKLINLKNYADTLFPDQVDFLVQPDMSSRSYYQFATTPDGKKLGCSRLATNAEMKEIRAEKLESFELSVIQRTNEWVSYFRIPWSKVGGKPASYFGIMPLRTRWRDGEVSSPVALDFMDEVNSTMKSGLRDDPAVDLFIETRFEGEKARPENAELVRLPSGVLRWQRPVVMTYPDLETRRQIWQMQESLSTPTDSKNLSQRLHLTRCWNDLMAFEGFTGMARASSAVLPDLQIYKLRREVNAALRNNDIPRACSALDRWVAQLDKISRWWYADGSPGNILTSEWTPIENVNSLEVRDKTLVMRSQAGNRQMDLHLALPRTGGIRLFGETQGFFKPDELLPLDVSRRSGTCSIRMVEGTVEVNQKPFSIVFRDPAGKKVTQVGPRDLSFRFGADGKVLAIDFKNRLDSDEAIYGFGERYDYFNQNGRVVTLWGTDDWVGNGVGYRNTTYKPLPIFHSSKGYMLYDNSTYRLRADVGKTDSRNYRITQQGPIFDFYFFIGAPEKSLGSYTALTGRVPLPPKWVFEPWMGRGESAWAGNPLNRWDPVQQETNTILKFAALDIPHSAIYAEGRTANNPVLHEFATPRGIRILGYFAPEMQLKRQQDLMPELKSEELPILRTADGTVCSNISYVDWTHPHATELVRRALKPALELGVAGSMVDFGDMVPDDALFYDGRGGAEMHNNYTYAYHKTVSEIYREKRGDDFILYGRAAAPGGQRWVGQFAGDHSGNFPGLRAVLNGALNLCACGYSTWGSDVCGYFGMPEPGVYMRWFQFACFSPIWRPHGKTSRDPWDYSNDAVVNYKFLAWTRENILDYTYNAAVLATETGVPIMRSMPVSFPGQQAVATLGDQYMFGPDMLVAPVLKDEPARTVVFPKGTWASLWDGQTVKGPARLKIATPLDYIPVYLRAGSVVPVQLNRELQIGQSMTPGRVSALIVTPPGATQIVPLVTDPGKQSKVTVQAAPRGCTWKLEGIPSARYLLVYGINDAKGIKVDGHPMPKVSGAFDTMAAGWQADGSQNRLIVRLASVPTPTSTRTIEVSFNR